MNGHWRRGEKLDRRYGCVAGHAVCDLIVEKQSQTYVPCLGDGVANIPVAVQQASI